MKTKKKTFKEWRKERGLRLEDIALKTGINFSTVARWDEGKVRSPIDIIRRPPRPARPAARWRRGSMGGRRDGRHCFVVSKDPGPPAPPKPFFGAPDICFHGYRSNHTHPGHHRRGCCGGDACVFGSLSECPTPKTRKIKIDLSEFRKWYEEYTKKTGGGKHGKRA